MCARREPRNGASAACIATDTSSAAMERAACAPPMWSQCPCVARIPPTALISTETQTRWRAVMPAICQSLRDVRTAGRASLRGAGGVHRDQLPPTVSSFVGEDAQELTPATIVYGLGEATGSQASYVQIFNGNATVGRRKPVGGLVVEVAALVRDMRVQAC